MKQRTPATGSERQAKYRRSRQLGGVFLSQETREAINALQMRMGLKKEDLVAKAIRNLTAEQDRKERRRMGKSGSDASRRAERPGGRSDANGRSSLSDEKASSSSAATGKGPPASTEVAIKRGSRAQGSGGKRGGGQQPDQPNLFDDFVPRR